MPARVYGLRRDLTEDMVDGNVTYRPFGEARFIEDLRTARAVVAGGGFTLLSEAVFLHKPVLSVPVERQFEQVLNALTSRTSATAPAPSPRRRPPSSHSWREFPSTRARWPATARTGTPSRWPR
jgi:hypothetical protein